MAETETYGPVEQARAWVRGHYGEQVSSVGSVMEIFSGKGKNQKSRLKPSRQAPGFSPTRIHATKSRSPKFSKAPIASGTCGGNIRRAIACLPGIHKNWIHYCYNPSPKAKGENLSRYRQRLSDRYHNENGATGLHFKTRSLITIMLAVQVHQSRSYSQYCRWSKSMPPELIIYTTKRPWSQTYLPHWIKIRELMDRIDKEALNAVYNSVT